MDSIDQYMVNIAKWLFVHPEVFVFLLPQNTQENLSEFHFKSLLEALLKSGCAVIVISFDQEILSKLCTRVISPTKPAES